MEAGRLSQRAPVSTVVGDQGNPNGGNVTVKGNVIENAEVSPSGRGKNPGGNGRFGPASVDSTGQNAKVGGNSQPNHGCPWKDHPRQSTSDGGDEWSMKRGPSINRSRKRGKEADKQKTAPI